MFIIEKDNKIIMADTDRCRLESTLGFMPDYAGCKIVETEREIAEIDGMYVYTDSAEYKSKQAQERIAELKQMLEDADYWTSKHADGEYTDEEWAEKVAIRKAWRVEINELEKVLTNTEKYATVEEKE